jgi:hypothetical protein
MSWASAMKKNFAIATVIFFIAAGIFILSALLLDRTRTSDKAFFNLLADAFLHGHIFLTNPPSLQDLVNFDGKWYVPFLPLPALLLLPWVAFVGIEHTNTVFFGSIMGALNTALAFLLLQSLTQRTWSKLSLTSNIGLTLLFGFGCVHWYMSIQGSVWFLGQICTVTFVLLSLWIAVNYQSPWLSGMALGLALLGRPNVIFVYPLLLAIGVQEEMGNKSTINAGKIARWTGLSILPLGVSVTLILGYNYLRFHNVFDFGYLTQNVVPDLDNDLRVFGQFSLRYVPHNVWSMLLAVPYWDKGRNLFLPNGDGMSIFLTTPALIYLHRSFQKNWLVAGAWLAVGLLLIPLLTYYNTGWWQFGYRFSLDFMPPVIVLLAFAAGERLSLKFWVLIMIGVLINAWGTWWFWNPLFF